MILYIARHGNTFDPGHTVLRVGKRTDLSLSRSGREQAKKLGDYLQGKISPLDRLIVSTLKRTQETAELALPHHPWTAKAMFDEIDYGVDDGKPEEAVIARIGAEALRQWDEASIVPPGWYVDTKAMIAGWHAFAEECLTTSVNHVVITSNGVARFALSLLDTAPQAVKLRTGALGALEYAQGKWRLLFWDYRP